LDLFPDLRTASVSDSRRIAFCITDLDPGGAERALVQIATGLAARGWETSVYCLSGPGELAAPLREAGIPVECLGARSPYAWHVVRRLTHALRRYRPALLQTFLFHANLSGRWAAWRAGVPTTVCGLRVAERDAPWRMRVDRWSQSLVRMNVCVSQGVADFAIREVGLPPNKVCVIRNGVEFERFAQARAVDWTSYGLPQDATVLLFIGRLHPQKGPELLLEAATPWLNQQSSLHLVYVGEGPLRAELEQQIENRSVRSRVHLLGRCPDVAPLLKGAAMLALPSRWEGLPNVLLEAMAAGCPVIATDVEGSREVLSHGENGLLCRVNSVAELREAIGRLWASPELRRSLAERSQDIVSEHFTWMSVVESYDRLYRGMLEC
jgi:glycosyltransferase involved in cell wall biosynthesis